MSLDRDHLTRLTRDPALTAGEDVAELRELVRRFPWFSGAHLLLAVGGHRQGDVLFEEQLRASVAHLPSRAVLHDQLQPRATPVTVHVRPTPAPVETLAAPLTVVRPEPAVEAAVPVEGPTVPVSEVPVIIEAAPPPAPVAPEVIVPPVVEPLAAEAEAPANTFAAPSTAAKPAVVEAPTVTEVPPPPAPAPTDPLDAQIRQSALATSYELLMEHPAIASAPSLNDPPARPAPRSTEAPAAPMRGARRFSDWLESASEPAPPTPAPTAIRAEDQGYEDTQALIARFIRQQGTTKSTFYSPVQAARRSVEDHADLVTETLARIHEKQGNVQKAIATYERLAQKFPERSAYFLEQVARLKG